MSEARLEPALRDAPEGEPVQFERQGYFCRDTDSTPDRPVFNRTVGLRDTFAKDMAKEKAAFLIPSPFEARYARAQDAAQTFTTVLLATTGRQPTMAPREDRAGVIGARRHGPERPT